MCKYFLLGTRTHASSEHRIRIRAHSPLLPFDSISKNKGGLTIYLKKCIGQGYRTTSTVSFSNKKSKASLVNDLGKIITLLWFQLRPKGGPIILIINKNSTLAVCVNAKRKVRVLTHGLQVQQRSVYSSNQCSYTRASCQCQVLFKSCFHQLSPKKISVFLLCILSKWYTT